MTRPILLAAMGLALLPAGCATSECTHGIYYASECRVAAENHYARIVTSAGADLRFHAAGATSIDGWAATGRFREDPDGVIVARPAGLGDFALSLTSPVAVDLSIRLENVAADATVTVGPLTDPTDVPRPDTAHQLRSLPVRVEPGEPVWITGTRACPDAYRLVAAGDVQTNPLQFERIVHDLHNEVAAADAAGEPLLGMLLLGDLSESSTDDEFRAVYEILASSPIPVATIPGNHDILGEPFALYNRWFGPGNHVFDVCRTRVTLLDSANGDLATSIEARLPTLLDRGDQDFLVAGTHYPAHAGRTGAGFADDMQAAYLLSELVRNQADVLFTGHVHTWREFTDIPVGDGTIDQVITGTAGASQGSGQPHFGVTRIRFGNQAQWCFVEVPEPGRAPGDPGAGSGPLRRCDDR